MVPARGAGISTTGLVGFHLHQRLIGPHPVALGHQPAHDLTLGNTFSHVREAKFQGHA